MFTSSVKASTVRTFHALDFKLHKEARGFEDEVRLAMAVLYNCGMAWSNVQSQKARLRRPRVEQHDLRARVRDDG